MEDALNQLLWALKDLIVPALAVALLGLLKFAMPRLKAAVPPVFYPFIALLFARMGTKLCYAIEAPCEGNFVNWSDPEAYALAQGLAVVGIREFAVWVKRSTPTLLGALNRQVGSPPAPPPPSASPSGPTVGLVLLLVLGAGACGPLPAAPKPVFTVGGYSLQRADCESLESYLAHNAQALALFEQLGGTILSAYARQGEDNLGFSGDAGFDYLGLVASVLKAQVGLGVRLNEIPNTFVLRPLTCHEFVPAPPARALPKGHVPPS